MSRYLSTLSAFVAGCLFAGSIIGSEFLLDKGILGVAVALLMLAGSLRSIVKLMKPAPSTPPNQIDWEGYYNHAIAQRDELFRVVESYQSAIAGFEAAVASYQDTISRYEATRTGN